MSAAVHTEHGLAAQVRLALADLRRVRASLIEAAAELGAVTAAGRHPLAPAPAPRLRVVPSLHDGTVVMPAAGGQPE